ncbi:MAG: hypothetical protein IKT28_00290, partial [Rikenellaceae bacterium]|nr:hypothetical protein [Rikenellaceae bacterium]
MTKFFLIICGVLMGISAQVQAQTIESLNEEIRRAEEEIEATNKLLKSTETKTVSSEKELKLVRNNISQRKTIIKKLNQQSSKINTNVKSKSRSVSSLEKELEALKSEYSEMLYNTYKHYKLNDYITFLFAAKDFNDIYRRIYYVKQYTQMREMKAAEIDSVTVKLNADIDSLNVEKQKLDKLKNQRNKELKSLSADEAKQKKIVSDLKSTSKRLNNKIRQEERKIQELQRSIQRLVSNEARKGQKSQRSAEFYALTGRFDQNKGKLPYPIEGGVIVDRYGQHEHPTQKGLVINNTGVNIAAQPGSKVRAVFEGEVM